MCRDLISVSLDLLLSRMKVEVAALLWFLRLCEKVGHTPGPQETTCQCEVSCECSWENRAGVVEFLVAIIVFLASTVVVLSCLLVTSGAKAGHAATSPRRKGGGFVQMPPRTTCCCILQ